MAGKKARDIVIGNLKKKAKAAKKEKKEAKALAEARQKQASPQTQEPVEVAGALPPIVFQTSEQNQNVQESPAPASVSNGNGNKADPNRVPTGIPGFDGLIEGGFERNCVILLGGDSGAGKTIFSLQYLYNGIMKYDEPGVYLSFAETREAIIAHGRRFGWDFEKLEKEKKFAFIRYEPHEVANIVKEGGGLIRDTIDDIGARRIVVDSVTAYSMFFKTSYEASESLLSLFELVHGWHCTTLLISEELVTLEKSRTDRSEFLADGIIYLYHFRRGDVRTRAVEVLKMRDTNITEKLCPFRIVEDGLIVFPDTGIFDELKQQF
jgi:circadian clock protein KaiC